jgi:hypothetical protein
MNENISFEGFLGMNDTELLAVVQRNPRAVKNLISTAAKTANPATTPQAASRNEFMEKISMLNPEIQAGLKAKTLQLSDTAIYITKSVSGAKTIKMFQDADNKIVGVSNISSGKLEKGEVFLCSGIQLLYGVGTGTAETQAGVAAVTGWGLIPLVIENGEFSFRASGKNLIDRMSLNVFRNFYTETVSNATPAIVGGVNYGDGMPGFYKFANPKLIETQQPIEFNLEWCAAATTNAYLKAVLIGTKVMKY